MKHNVGKTEGLIRVALGIGLLAYGFYKKSWAGIFGLAPILSGSTGYCPVNQSLGIDTSKNEETLIHSMTGKEIEEFIPVKSHEPVTSGNL